MLKLKHFAIASTLAAAALLVAPAALACDGDDNKAATTAAAPKASIQTITVSQLAKKLENAQKPAQKSPVTLAIFDANTDATRADQGVIPTAILLPSSTEYDMALLPKNKTDDVVFYCAAEKCGASKSAAKKAIEAGYTNVHVLPAGIAGWVKAGQPTEKLAKAPAQPQLG